MLKKKSDHEHFLSFKLHKLNHLGLDYEQLSVIKLPPSRFNVKHMAARTRPSASSHPPLITAFLHVLYTFTKVVHESVQGAPFLPAYLKRAGDNAE